MTQQIQINKIAKNPFQSRRRIDAETVKDLAKEIAETGFWSSTIRVRAINGTYELVAGHRRIEALKQLGRKTVEAEIVELDNMDMAKQSLIENLQRHSLLEIDKAEAIKQLLDMMTITDSGISKRKPLNRNEAIQELCLLFGYADSRSIEEFLTMTTVSEPTKTIIRKANLGRGTVIIAKRLAGEKMVQQAAANNISKHDLEAMHQELSRAPEKVQDQIRDKLRTGKITKPEQVHRAVYDAAIKNLTDKLKASDRRDFTDFVSTVTFQLRDLTKKFNDAVQRSAIVDFIQNNPNIVADCRAAFEDFQREAKVLLYPKRKAMKEVFYDK